VVLKLGGIRRRAEMGARFERRFRVMKKGIHPDYHFVEVQLNDGTTYRTRTTYGTAGQKITLDIDPTTHPAWTGGQQQLMDRGGRLTRFNKKFAGFVKG
jgi:large subunit ribosomal protein L31